MVEPLAGHKQSIGRSAEQAMRKWALSLQVQENLSREEPADLAPAIHPYLAVSRESGAAGSEVAAHIGARLGWQVLDRQLLHHMAERYGLEDAMLEFVDETASNWVIELFGKWVNKHLVTQAEYAARLGRIVFLAAQHASTVFVGRGAQFLLPRERGFAVQIIAPRDQRIERVQQVKSIGRNEAAKYIDEQDRGRADFVKKYFHRRFADPHLYDLVVNLERFSTDDAVELIVDQVKKRFGV